MSLTMITAT